LLDVGCHAGRFLRLAGQAGWRAEGTEINERTAAHAAASTGVPVHRLSAERLDELGRRFDAVTLTDVLEHIPQPVTLLSTVRRVVADDGWVAIKVPCGPAQRVKETWRARLSRGYRATLADNLVHISHFSPRALRSALERAGFDEITVEIAARVLAPGWDVRRLALFQVGRRVPGGVHSARTAPAGVAPETRRGPYRRHDAMTHIGEPVNPERAPMLKAARNARRL
jgi:SAM-dependent methyltransferase